MKHPKALVDRVRAALALDAPAWGSTYFSDRPDTLVEDLADAVLDALLVDPIVVQTLRDGHREITWPDDPAPHESRLVACTRDLIQRLVDDTARTVAELHEAKADLDRIGGELEQLSAATAPAPVRWAGPDPRDEGFTELEVAAAWALARIARLPMPDQYVWSILRDYQGARAFAAREAKAYAVTPQDQADAAAAAAALRVTP